MLTPAPATKLAYSIPEAAAALSISRSALYELIRAGSIPRTKIGTRSVIRHAALEAFLDAMDKAA